VYHKKSAFAARPRRGYPQFSRRAAVDAARFRIERSSGDSVVRILVSGELDLENTARFRREWQFDCDNDVEVVLVDLSGVQFIDSSGLHALVAAHRHLGDRLAIIASAPCSHLIDLTGLRRILPIIEG
jgi:anti-sigma B factor antagonist